MCFARFFPKPQGGQRRYFGGCWRRSRACRRGKLDDQVQDEDALLARLRAEKAGILNWAVEGAIKAHSRMASEP